MARLSFGSAKNGIDGYTRNGDDRFRNAQCSQVDLGLFQCNKVLVDMVAQPHGMNVEISDDYRVYDLDFSLGLQRRDYSRR